MKKRTIRMMVIQLLLTLSALAAALPMLPVQAAPADPFTGASPTFSATPKEATNYNVGDWGVADQRGVATYTFDLALPPGRNGMAPSLALRYSSGSPLRGGIAAGWTLNLPTIEQDYALGVDGGPHYKASLGNASERLEAVDDALAFADTDGAYHLNFDNTFTRFFRRKQGADYTWSALTSDGITHHFSKYPIDGTDPRWRIERQEDSFGNTIVYFWSPVKAANGNAIIDYALNRIEYASNAAAGLDAYAKVEFEYAPLEVCQGSNAPIGAAKRASGEVDGALRLTGVRTYVRDTPAANWRLSRQTTLGYDLRASKLYVDEQVVEPTAAVAGVPDADVSVEDVSDATVSDATVSDAAVETLCYQDPLRYLTRIDVAASAPDGVVTTLPPVTFEYNSRIDTTAQVDGPAILQPMHPRELAVAGYAQFGNAGNLLGGIQGDSLDIDGDGILDRVAVMREDDLCKLVWHKGLLGGDFESEEHKSSLPTAAWYAQWKGHADPAATAFEGCTLNGQIAYRDYKNSGGPGTISASGVVGYHFLDYTGDGRLDLVTHVWATVCHWTYAPEPPHIGGDDCSFADDSQLLAAASSVGPEPPVGSPGFIAMSPEQTSPFDGGGGSGSHRYLWRVYPGTGNPDNLFEKLNILHIRSPLPLSPSVSEDRLDTSAVVKLSVPPLIDLDGDGFLDIIDTRDSVLTTCDNQLLGHCDWTVYFGNGGGTFPEPTDAYVWDVPEFNVNLSEPIPDPDACGLTTERLNTTLVGLHDISGDGLPDLLVQKDDGALYAYVNRGRRFSTGALPLNTSRPVERTQTDCKKRGGNNELLDGWRGDLQRLVDLDGDHLLDMLVVADGVKVDDIAGEYNMYARFNVGNRFGPLRRLPNAWSLGKRLLEAGLKPEGDNVYAGEWRVDTDFTDVTGDGLADLAQWQGDKITYINHPGLSNAPDLLAAVNNGRGMRIKFTYAPSTDATVVQWTGATQALLPYVSWVVKQTTVSGGFNMPEMTTTYRYQDPRYLSSKAYSGVAERSEFAGFTQSIANTTVTEGATREVRRHYGYQALNGAGNLVSAPSGFLEQESTYLNGDLYQYTENEWLHLPLFGGKVQVTLPAGALGCVTNGPGQTPQSCMAQDSNVHRVQQSWTAAPTGGAAPCMGGDSSQPPSVAKLYLNTLTQEGSGVSQGALDRRTLRCYEVRYGQGGFAPDDYRVLLGDSIKQDIHLDGKNATFETRSHTRVHHDPATGLPVQTDQWLNEATVATTFRTYENATGNLLTQTKPEQGASGGSGKQTAFVYDANHLFVEGTTDELGHQTYSTHDLATGAILEQRGPNFITLPSNDIAWQRELWRIDGFGRILEHDLSFDDGAQYALHTVDKIAYFDNEQPNRIRTEHLRDVGGDVSVTAENKLDGLGRVLTETLFLDDGKSALTTYAYDANGDLAVIETPDPRSDSARVRYTYLYDALGRVIQFTRPDNSGVAISYAGLTKTIQETTGDGSGAKRMEVYDTFGRLVELHEFDPTAPTAISRYQYDGQDNLIRITDAEGNQTLLGHDYLGNRISVTRGERTWRYFYDRNGNLVSRQAPTAGEAAVAAAQTTTYRYDDLDRITQLSFQDLKIGTPTPPPTITGDVTVFLPVVMQNTNTQVVSAANPPALETQSVLSVIHYTYDQGRNGVGRLSQADLPFGKILYSYEARGLVAAEERSFTLSGIATVNATQRVERQYNALGQPTLSTWDDGQQWQITYDARGLVDTVQWYDPQAKAWKAVADYDRSLLGLPRTRNSAYGQSRQYTYDSLGRTTAESVLVNGNPNATRGYTFNGAGDLTHTTGATAGVSAEATYTYDAQHRLKSASGPNGYASAFTYSANGNVATASINWNGSPEARQVSYQYGDRDPQAVDQLINQANGQPYAEFAYDLSGNMVERKTPEGNSTLLWDGRDQMRVVSGPNGVEVYFYDDAGMRMLAVSESEGVRFWFGESETHYSLDGAQTLRYLHLAAGTALARVENKNKIELQYTDALQNLMFSLDGAGKSVASFLYGAFGEVVSATGDADHHRQFNGKENDVVSGLRYYGYRYYDPLTLRWASADPLYRVLPDLGLGEPQRMNLYAFSLNNPVRYYDPDGRDSDKGDSSTEVNTCSNVEEQGCEEGAVAVDESCQTDTENECVQESGSEETTHAAAEKSANDSIEGLETLKVQVKAKVTGLAVKSLEGGGSGVKKNSPSLGIGFKDSLGIKKTKQGEHGSVSVGLTLLSGEGGISVSAEGFQAKAGVSAGTMTGCADVCIPTFVGTDVCLGGCGSLGFTAQVEAKVSTEGVKIGGGIGLAGVEATARTQHGVDYRDDAKQMVTNFLLFR